jgi:hypothetical protein
MVYSPPELKKSGKPLVTFRRWGIGLILAFFGGRYMILEIERLNDSLSDVLTMGHLLLLVITIILVFLWIWATDKELDLCFTWLDPDHYVPPKGLEETVMILGESILLCLLLWASFDPLYYAIIFTLYSYIITFTNKYALRQVHKAIALSKERLAKDLEDPENKDIALEYIKGVNVLDTFFIKRPWMKRFIIIDITSLLALGLGIVWKITENKFLGLLTYIFLFIIILVSELVIAKWRITRDHQLYSIEAEINEFSRDKK